MNETCEPASMTGASLNDFRQDVLKGLKAEPKQLQSKYFYDAQGDELFQQIMRSPEYYLTNCEMEIFKEQCAEMIVPIKDFKDGFDLIELGAGDASKSFYFLECLMSHQIDFTYIPIDISPNIISMLNESLPERLPGISVKGMQGDYFDALEKVIAISSKPKLLMFLGGNIGNMTPEEALEFCTRLRRNLRAGDMVLIGFDLKKDPWVIFNAYNDHEGITEKFNLNLLSRINSELGGDFDLDGFHHYESYDPESGACKSYLISNVDQVVTIGGERICFAQNEFIYTETSHKYDPGELDQFSFKAGFQPMLRLTDSRGWFTDVIWRAV